jgi:hypothetical protein
MFVWNENVHLALGVSVFYDKKKGNVSIIKNILNSWRKKFNYLAKITHEIDYF